MSCYPILKRVNNCWFFFVDGSNIVFCTISTAPPSSNEKTTPIAKRNLSTPPKPKNFLPDSSTRPNLPKKPQVLNNVGKQTIAPKTDKTPPNPSNKPPTLPPKPTEDAPPALPPNHPKRDGNSDEGGSAGSTSSGSGGVMVNRAFKSELKEVIGSQLCLRNAQKNQVLGNCTTLIYSLKHQLFD